MPTPKPNRNANICFCMRGWERKCHNFEDEWRKFGVIKRFGMNFKPTAHYFTFLSFKLSFISANLQIVTNMQTTLIDSRRWLCRIQTFGMWHRVALVRTDVLEEHVASIIRVIKIVLRKVHRLLVTANVVPNSPTLFTLSMEAISSSETSVLTTVTQRHIPEYWILQHE
jgi:hypothetical protein